MNNLPVLKRVSNGGTAEVTEFKEYGYGAGVRLQARPGSTTANLVTAHPEAFEVGVSTATFTFTAICEVEAESINLFMVDEQGNKLPPMEVKIIDKPKAGSLRTWTFGCGLCSQVTVGEGERDGCAVCDFHCAIKQPDGTLRVGKR